MNKVEIDQIILSRRQFVSGSTVALAAWIVGCSPAATAPAVAASGITPPPEIPLTPTAVPPIPTLAPSPTEAATAVPTIEPSVTNVPATATENPSPTAIDTVTSTVVPATNTPKPEATPKPENPLPDYGVFWGIVKDPKTGKKLGEIEVARIPTEGSNDMFTFWITSPDSDGSRLHGVHQYSNNDHVNNGSNVAVGSLEKAVYDKTTNTIKGTDFNGGTCELEFVGTSKQTIITTMEKIIKDQSSDQPTTPEKELKLGHVNPDLWP